MIGVVLSGHGNFAEGLYSSIQLIAGSQENLQTVDFTEGMSSEILQENLKNAVNTVNQNQGVVIFTDIPGGTPYNQAVMLSTQLENVKVISGTNIPALLDGLFCRNLSLDEFSEKVIGTGKAGLQQFEFKAKEKKESNMEDGI